MPKHLSIPFAICLLAAIGGASDPASDAYREGQKAEHAGDKLKAYLLYARAAQLEPANRIYSERRAALSQASALRPQVETSSDPARDPANETNAAKLVAEGLKGGELLDSPAAAPPPQLAASGEKHSFALRGGARDVLQEVAGAYGIQILFDPAYQEPASLKFAITDAGYQEALRALEVAADSFLVPVNESTVLAARDTVQNRTQLMPVMAIIVPIPERMTLQEAQELSTAVQQTLEIRRVSLDAQRHAVYFRDTVSKVLAAREMFADLSRLRAQVSVDIEFLSISKTSSLSYGLALPTSSAIVDFGTPFTGAVPAVPSGSAGFARLGGGNTLLGIGVANSAAFATLSRASGTTVLESQIVALDGQAATFHVGDHYPVTTATFSNVSGTTAQGTGLTPTITFEDLGLTLKLTPTVHEEGEVSLDIDAQFKTLGTGGANGIPSIATQQYQGKVRLKGGEWAVVAGLVSVTHTENPTGVLGLADLPLIGHLFRHQVREDDRDDILLVLKPHLIAAPAWEQDTMQSIWTGTETRPLTTF